MAGKQGTTERNGTARWWRCALLAVCFCCLLTAPAAHATSGTTYWVDVCANGNLAPSLTSVIASPANSTMTANCGSGSSNTLQDSVTNSGCSGSPWACTTAAPVGERDAWQVAAPAGETITRTADSAALYLNKADQNGASADSWNQGFSWLSQSTWFYSGGVTGETDCFGNGSECDGTTGAQSGSFSAPGVNAIQWGASCSWITGSSDECYDDGSLATLQGWRVQLTDPNPAPVISFPASTFLSDAGHWISGAAHANDGLAVALSDPGGICQAGVSLVPQWTQDGATAGVAVDAVSQNATDYDAADDSLNDTTCNGPGSVIYTPGLSGVPTGAYAVQATAENPGDQEGGATGATSTAATINVDNNTPSVALTGPSQAAWLPGPQTVTVSASDGTETQGQNSGIADTTCTNAVNQTWTNGAQGAGDSYAGTQSTAVTVTGAGVKTLDCDATNGVATVSPGATYTLHIDPQVPKLRMSKITQAPVYLKRAPTFRASAAEARHLSGATAGCRAHNATTGDSLKSGGTSAKTALTLTSGGKWTVTCSATTGAGRTMSHTERVDLDIQKFAPPVLGYAFDGNVTTISSLNTTTAPAGTKWTVTFDALNLAVTRSATTPKQLANLVAWLKKQRFLPGDTLSFTLTRKGYHSEHGVLTFHDDSDPTV